MRSRELYKKRNKKKGPGRTAPLLVLTSTVLLVSKALFLPQKDTLAPCVVTTRGNKKTTVERSTLAAMVVDRRGPSTLIQTKDVGETHPALPACRLKSSN